MPPGGSAQTAEAFVTNDDALAKAFAVTSFGCPFERRAAPRNECGASDKDSFRSFSRNGAFLLITL
jgi:hypothetical protein